MSFKKITSIILASAMALSLCACGNGAASAPASAEAGAEAQVESESPAEDEAQVDAEEPAEMVTLKVGLMGKSIKPVGVIMADALGYFEEEGVKIETEKVSSMNDAYMAVSTGDLDVYLFSSTAAATFITQGTTTLRVFGGTAAEGSEIMAKAGVKHIESADDLVGKKIACQMPETGQMVLKDYLLKNGYTIGGEGEDADVTFIYVQDGNTALEGCLKGEYDYCITNECKGYFADDFGAEVVGTVKQFVDPYPCCRQTCNEKTYEEHFDALVAFERAVLRGYQYYKENMEETLDILVAYSEADRDFVKAQVYGTENYTPVMRLSLDPDKQACIKFYEALANIGEISDTVEVDWDKYVVSDVYGAALADLAEREPDTSLWKELTDYFNTHN
ncbi:MAG: ABC transporter substrate-binding protein [Lachnospiraceae bacterium]|nr:ABC transporter substrate-binding protein [Lachnospiraceae bacterium]